MWLNHKIIVLISIFSKFIVLEIRYSKIIFILSETPHL